MRNILAGIVFLFFNSSLYAAGSEPSEILKLSYREIFLNQDRAWSRQNVAGNNFDFMAGFAPELNIKIRSERSKRVQSFILKDIGAGVYAYFDSLAYRLVYENGIIRMYLPNWELEGQAYLNIVDLVREANNYSIRVLLYSVEYGVLIEDFDPARYAVLLKNDLYGRITVFRFKETDLNEIVWFDRNGILKRGDNLVFYQRQKQ